MGYGGLNEVTAAKLFSRLISAAVCFRNFAQLARLMLANAESVKNALRRRSRTPLT